MAVEGVRARCACNRTIAVGANPVAICTSAEEMTTTPGGKAMGSRRTRSGSMRLWLIAAVAIAVSLLCATRAHAGSYTVVTCEAAPDGHSNHSWSQANTGYGYYNGAGCPNDSSGTRQGLLAMAGLNVA